MVDLSVAKEIGLSKWSLSPTAAVNHLVKGAHVLGENDDKHTNVNNIQFSDNENKIDLGI